MRELVEFTPYFRSVNGFCSLKASQRGPAAPYARLSGYCLKENPDCSRDSGVHPRKQWGGMGVAVSSGMDFILVFLEQNFSPIPLAVFLHY